MQVVSLVQRVVRRGEGGGSYRGGNSSDLATTFTRVVTSTGRETGGQPHFSLTNWKIYFPGFMKDGVQRTKRVSKTCKPVNHKGNESKKT